MVDEFPGNSRRERNAPEPKEDPKKIEAVVTGDVVRRKKPLGKRLIETFFGGDSKTVGHYVLMDVILPAAKDTFADAVSQAIERMLFGEARSSSRRTGARPSGTSGYTSYNRFSTSKPGGTPPWRDREDPKEISRQSRARHDFDEIILATRVEAEEVIDRLFDLVSRYEEATIADLYELVGITANFTDEKWGWTDIRGAGVTRIRNGYLLDLPRPEPLKR